MWASTAVEKGYHVPDDPGRACQPLRVDPQAMPAFFRLIRFLGRDNRIYYGDALLPPGVDDIAAATQARIGQGDIFDHAREPIDLFRPVFSSSRLLWPVPPPDVAAHVPSSGSIPRAETSPISAANEKTRRRQSYTHPPPHVVLTTWHSAFAQKQTTMDPPTEDGPSPTATHPLKLFDAARQQDRFLYACAPMVRYSKLAFRQTVHKYGVDLCWTPMVLAKEFNRNDVARDSDLTVSTRGPQPPTILQFGANSALELSRAASLAAPFVSGVDLNCGCPQSWACAETLGAALMDRRELVRDMVVDTRQRLARDGWAVGLDADMESSRGRSVSVKIRVHSDLRKTMDFLDTVIGHPQSRLVDWITIHPRTRHTPSTTPIRTDALEILTTKYASTLPILLSGDVFALSCLPFDGPSDADPRPSNTRISGFMSARGLLANPALFAGYSACPWEALETFMCNVARCPLPFKLVAHHVTQMCGPGMGADKSALLPKKERAKLADLDNMLDLVDFLDSKIGEQTGRAGGLRRDL
ncbi:hypothetical protein XA68_14351 [Ophiocordyceps unilateralis]|uniref:DUS-like FMN-binding domain-containing protein n=1 Tax=Ophiocordyceps unilateralis TaxID=268505 RepID=A0A2A9PAL7_OPHUN|nr:hypothetical protein XA68_14351 [Ophiocordyceps unilateralis]